MFRCFYFFNKNESNRLRSELQTSDWPVRDGSSTVYLKYVCCFNTNLTSDHILGETSPVSVSNVGSVAKFEFKSKDISRVFVAEPLHKPLQGGVAIQLEAAGWLTDVSHPTGSSTRQLQQHFCGIDSVVIPV